MKKLLFSVMSLFAVSAATESFAFTEPGVAMSIGRDLYCLGIGTCFSDHNDFNKSFIPGKSYEINFPGGKHWAVLWNAEVDGDTDDGESHFTFEIIE